MLTLHGNPIAEEREQYWPRLLSMLMCHPNRRVELKMVDFVKLTPQDFTIAGAHNMFATGDTTLLSKAKTLCMTKTNTAAAMTGTFRSK
ncbi:hypothetical protein STCU_12190 [Strigomonas culicis]|uniref:Uncharacterized protein n=1 Tax=Strigomonas culicis TaxID=28005 RepID=S9TFY6_9TRYP|nr:hypothetical protein STCU_12190 [Strigomonas culicis]|eukprot:EPY15258.1 hypothetical protein STCU_12190 [Strigomonas culicis]